MKIDFSTPIMMRSAPVSFVEGTAAKLGDAGNLALNAVPDGVKLSLEEMVMRGKLAMRVGAGGEQDVTPEEIALIRQMLPAAFKLPELVAVIYTMLDPA